MAKRIITLYHAGQKLITKDQQPLEEFVSLQKTFEASAKSWLVDVANIDQSNWDLSVKNPNVEEEAPLRAPKDIIAEIIALDKESEAILESIQEIL